MKASRGYLRLSETCHATPSHSRRTCAIAHPWSVVIVALKIQYTGDRGHTGDRATYFVFRTDRETFFKQAVPNKTTLLEWTILRVCWWAWPGMLLCDRAAYVVESEGDLTVEICNPRLHLRTKRASERVNTLKLR